MKTQMLKRQQVEALTGLSRSTIYAKLDGKSAYHDKDFPKPVKIGQRAVRWYESEVDVYMKDLAGKSI